MGTHILLHGKVRKLKVFFMWKKHFSDKQVFVFFFFFFHKNVIGVH